MNFTPALSHEREHWTPLSPLPRLRRLGITAIELMPIAEFPGDRNWGYDGVYPFAVEHSYGGIDALQRLVDASHGVGLAVVLDVVYNHLGPEGNYLGDFGPYFTSRYRTLWGDALNFDGPDSDPVRRFFLENALYWIEDVGIDALRLDAIHAIFDQSAYPFLQELASVVHQRSEESGRKVYLIAESDLNDPRVIHPAHQGGLSLDAQWSDDFHHALHTLLTGEASGYYSDFGELRQFAAAMQDGWVYQGQYSRFRRRRFGSAPVKTEARQFVVCSQNHDQVGNRMNGERLITLAGPEAARLAAACVLLSPYVPLLFMGEEYGRRPPVSSLCEPLRPRPSGGCSQRTQGGVREFSREGEPRDPQDHATFLDSKLGHYMVKAESQSEMQEWYAKLIRLRRTHPALRPLSKTSTIVECDEECETITVFRFPVTPADQQAIFIFHFGKTKRKIGINLGPGEWSVVLDSGNLNAGGDRLLSTGECFPFVLGPQGFLALST